MAWGEEAPAPPVPRWDWGFEATAVTQVAPSFRSPYEGEHSFMNEGSGSPATTFVTTLYGAVRLWKGAWISIQPEFSDGSGVGGGTGIAAYPNVDVLRVPAIAGKPYIARAFIQQGIPLGEPSEAYEPPPFPESKFLPGGAHLFGVHGAPRLEITFGKLDVADIFDTNAFVGDAHHGLTSWGLVNNGAWDFSADTRGYTWGLTAAYEGTALSARAGVYMMPTVANGVQLDHDLRNAHAVNAEVEWDFDRERAGAVRLLGYVNSADMGSYEEALSLAAASGTTPDIAATREPGRKKYGVGLNAQYRLTSDLGLFGRLGWNDGRTETFCYTEIDQTAVLGAMQSGALWKRPDDDVSLAVVASGISGVHKQYLAAGGLGFQLGDGRLSYAPEIATEFDYAAKLTGGVSAGLDVQYVVNPGFNRDRGPVVVFGVRLHAHF